MTRLITAVCLLAVLSLACSVSALQIPAQIGEQATPSLVLPKNKPTNAPNSTDGVIYVTAAESLYIRSEPNHYAKVVGHLLHDETVTIYECSGVWGRIGAGKWVNSIYLSERCEK